MNVGRDPRQKGRAPHRLQESRGEQLVVREAVDFQAHEGEHHPDSAGGAEAGDGDTPVEIATDVRPLAPAIDYVVGHPPDPRLIERSKQVLPADSSEGDNSYKASARREVGPTSPAGKSSIKYCMNCCCHLALSAR